MNVLRSRPEYVIDLFKKGHVYKCVREFVGHVVEHIEYNFVIAKSKHSIHIIYTLLLLGA
jgi:hypothetical protein